MIQSEKAAVQMLPPVEKVTMMAWPHEMEKVKPVVALGLGLALTLAEPLPRLSQWQTRQ